ncbi:alpha-N-arabinofuranosidase [Rhizomicrobium palustre]|uniref:non-reducing end alpha-L-arabinofuranosidase n=1 Tax=Rhizomicrobium palustre TaxID=189966 RepID=A0A846MZG7_9PROT|nr:alpha-L-arabinofuranosidase C-terminal domain-containing protein [Rhizomicrobium palustre]NIK88836.1 alpha-N-arabinofuranosidase [Rhizomicrobium palustre]
MRRLAPWVMALSLVSIPALAEGTITVSVDTAKPGAKIDRHIFGQFAEHLGTQIYDGIWVGKTSKIPNTGGIRNDVVGALKALHVPVVRWPGGCYADQYHWRDGVGKKRVARVNAAWGNAPEPNTFGTDEFMTFAKLIGAEAYISLNVGSGTVKEAADWVEYMTAPTTATLGKERAANGHPEPYAVHYIGIGNESWDCGGLMTPEDYVQQMKLYARFVNNYNTAVPTQKVAVGPGGDDTVWTDAVMETWKKRHGWSFDINGMSLHSYTWGAWPPSHPSTGFGEDEYAFMLKDTLHMEPLVAKQAAAMDKFDPEKKISLTVDEWGAWLAPTPGSNPAFLQQQNSQRDAVLAALNLNIFFRHADRIRMTNIAQMVNVLQAMILTEGNKMVLTPTYHLFKMYVPFQDSTFLPVSFDAGTYKFGDITLPKVDAVAAKTKDGKIVIALTNIDAKSPASFSVKLPGALGTAKGEVLSAPKLDSVNSFTAPETVKPKAVSATVTDGTLSITLAPASVTVLTLN